MRRIISLIVAVSMMMPALASAVDAAIGTWLAPQPGQKITTRFVEVSVGFNTQSNVEVTHLELWVDGKVESQKRLVHPATRGVVSFSWDTASYAKGPHDLVVKIYSYDKLISTVSSTGTVGDVKFDKKAPIVTFSNIKSGDVLKGTATIKLKAEDDSGEPPLVSLLVDNKLKMLRNTPPYKYDLDTTTYEDGSHELQTYAYDGAGNKSNPAVVKVVFKNGFKNPVVAAMTVAPEAKAISGGNDNIVDLLPSLESTEKASGKSISAARSSEAVITSLPSPAAPEIKQNDIAVAAASPEVFSSKPPSISLPGTISPNEASSITQAVRGWVSSDNDSVPIQPDILPESAQPKEVIVDVPSSDIETSSKSEPEPLLMAMLPDETLNPEVEMQDLTGPASSFGKICEPDKIAAQIEVSNIQLSAANEEGVASSPEQDAPSVAQPMPRIAAIDPDIRNTTDNERPAINCRPVAILDRNAKLEKKYVLLSGKVKLRDLVHELGGWLVWDASTRTVTAFVGNMKLEMVIGSKVMLVNGREMKVDEAPYISNGRTIINAGIYHQACNFLNEGAVSASVR